LVNEDLTNGELRAELMPAVMQRDKLVSRVKPLTPNRSDANV
jgi:hypothetical protein